MSYDPEKKQEEKKGVFGVIMHSFFVVPFLLAVLSVLLFAAVRILTMEKRSVYDYLNDVKMGGANKRWQSAFELSRILSNQSEVPQDEKFVTQMLEAYEASKHDDERVKQYIILAMARSSRGEFADVLVKNIDEEKDENLYAIIFALGILKSNQAVSVLLKYLNHDSARIRLATVIALGNIGDKSTIPALLPLLNDNEPNVVWDTAIALSKMDNRDAKGVILNLLDRAYLKNFPNLTPMAQSKIVMVALQATAHWNDADIISKCEELFKNDPNMQVRALAKQIVDKKI